MFYLVSHLSENTTFFFFRTVLERFAGDVLGLLYAALPTYFAQLSLAALVTLEAVLDAYLEVCYGASKPYN